MIAAGVPFGPLFQRLKAGESVTLDDGRTIHGKDFIAPATPGKKIAIFGDTAPCESALEMARDVDVMVHEATLEAAMAEKANSRGHSSTEQTAQLARAANAKRLIVTHVSSRYDAEGCRRLLAECRNHFPACELAEDFCHLHAGITFCPLVPITLLSRLRFTTLRAPWITSRKRSTTGQT
ncbi:Ribonuclease BN [Kluyvera cryocrescens]|uniref:Ribonuclease BN n=1 Tax=Kluyvera cryocrescens TaxID=580 RepID=A0A485AW30_KLUCR|nr:Ribonuclease BN [Kluyvera cryocrescens]